MARGKTNVRKRVFFLLVLLLCQELPHLGLGARLIKHLIRMIFLIEVSEAYSFLVFWIIWNNLFFASKQEERCIDCARKWDDYWGIHFEPINKGFEHWLKFRFSTKLLVSIRVFIIMFITVRDYIHLNFVIFVSSLDECEATATFDLKALHLFLFKPMKGCRSASIFHRSSVI